MVKVSRFFTYRVLKQGSYSRYLHKKFKNIENFVYEFQKILFFREIVIFESISRMKNVKMDIWRLKNSWS